MGALKNLLPLIILFTVIGFAAFIGYHLYVWSNEMADKGLKKMEKKNVTFNKDGGLKVGVKALSNEQYADKQQSYLVKAWNYSSMPAYKSMFWNKEEQARQKALAKNGGSSPASGNLPATSSGVRANNGLNIPQQGPRSGPRTSGSGNVGGFPEY